jgi:hypothetical protein
MSAPKLPKRTIKNDPFADLIPEPPVEGPNAEPIASKAEKSTPALRSKAPRRAKVTVVLDGALVERIRNAAYWNPELSVAGVAEMGIKIALERIEKEHGGAYPPRSGKLRAGRPLKAD